MPWPNRCSHCGSSLHEGELNDRQTLACPCHGSTFRLDGSIVKCPETSSQPAYDTRGKHGKEEGSVPPERVEHAGISALHVDHYVNSGAGAPVLPSELAGSSQVDFRRG